VVNAGGFPSGISINASTGGSYPSNSGSSLSGNNLNVQINEDDGGNAINGGGPIGAANNVANAGNFWNGTGGGANLSVIIGGNQAPVNAGVPLNAGVVNAGAPVNSGAPIWIPGGGPGVSFNSGIEGGPNLNFFIGNQPPLNAGFPPLSPEATQAIEGEQGLL
jgi:hypothetical protein